VTTGALDVRLTDSQRVLRNELRRERLRVEFGSFMRNGLSRLLNRAYLKAHLSIEAKVPVAEVEGLLQAQLSRRRVLQAGGVVAGLTAIPKPLRFADAGFDQRVLVVGAGIAGMTVAYRLRQARIPVDVVEASSRIGGRLKSVNGNPDSPSTVELGGEFIDTRHTAVRNLAAELGLELADLKLADAGLVPEIFYFEGKPLSHEAVAEAFVPMAKQIVRDLKALGSQDFTYRNPSPHGKKLDRLSIADYISSVEIDSTLEKLVRVAYITEYGREVEEQSCFNMLFLIGSEVGKWSTYGVSDERWHVVGGNQQIPLMLAEKVKNAISLNTALESVRTTADGRYRVSLRQGNTSRERTYDHVVLTVPFTVLRQVELSVEMPEVKRRAIAELGYGTCSKLAVPFKERIWRTRYDSTISMYTDLDCQNIWESARYSPGPSGWVTNLRGGKEGLRLGGETPEFHATQLVSDLEPLFPGIRQVERGHTLRAFWAAEPTALGSYSCYRPGQWTTFGGAERERVGNLWFAGEHCSMGSQGYMNGACETAEAVARSLLAELGVKVNA
jgi:monoamine oxidase